MAKDSNASEVEMEYETKYYIFDEAMCGSEFDGDMDKVSEYLTRHGYPSVPYQDAYNGAPSEASQRAQSVLIPPDSLFFEAVAAACVRQDAE